MPNEIAKKSLTDTLASLGIGICNVETSEFDAKTKIGDMTIIVSYPKAIGGISYYFKSADLEVGTAFYATYKEVDWSAIVSSVLFNKYDSCAWVARKVCDQLRGRSYDTVVDIRASKACRLVGHYSTDGQKERYLAFMIYQIPGSRNGSYNYSLETLNGKLVAQVKEATTDEVIKRLTDAIIAESSPKESKSLADDGSPLEQLFEAVKENCDKQTDSNISVAFKMSKSFSINTKGTDDGFFITYEPYTKEILVYQYTVKESNAYYYKLFMRTDTINEEIMNKIVSFVCNSNRGLF